tara:strand:- start:203 stop:760 length:558 start_codon:yes stop_codon:yes gene_type:complete
MNRFFWSFFILFVGCTSPHIKNKSNLIVKTNISISPSVFQTTKINTITRLYTDSVVISINPLLGIELMKILVYDNKITIHNRITNTVLSPNTFDPDFNFNKFKKHVIQKRIKRDTISFETEVFTYLFTDYVSQVLKPYNKSIFLPGTIILNQKRHVRFQEGSIKDPRNSIDYFKITLEYKSFVFK